MRVWRVGTISMGASLVLLGVILLISQFKNWDIVHLFIAWWPFLLIVLGVEILVYLFLAKQETVRIKYDFLSIIFIGVLGTVALGFMFLSVSGFIDEIRHSVQTEEATYDLPVVDEYIAEHIERVVLRVDAGDAIRIEGTDSNQLQVFGTYRAIQKNRQSEIESIDDYVTMNESGNTLYVTIKQPPRKHGILFTNSVSTNVVVLIPANIELEYERNQGYGIASIRPGDLQNNWSIHEIGEVRIQLMEQSDVIVKAEEDIWETGEGTYEMYVTSYDSDAIDVNIK